MSEPEDFGEPWRYEDDGGPFVLQNDRMLLLGPNEFSNAWEREAYPRIAACINACAGIPSEVIASGALREFIEAATIGHRRRLAQRQSPMGAG